MFKLSEEEAVKGVVTHSSGNHAQALALAAQLRGVSAHIVMPENAPAVKRRAVEGYGANGRPALLTTVFTLSSSCMAVLHTTAACHGSHDRLFGV